MPLSSVMDKNHLGDFTAPIGFIGKVYFLGTTNLEHAAFVHASIELHIFKQEMSKPPFVSP